MPTNIKGRSYNTVAERLMQAHGDSSKPTGIQSIITKLLSFDSDYVVIQSEVTFTDGRVFTGMASQSLTLSGTSADATSPLETCETSAIGRALAAAGYLGSDDGIAGAEEVRSAQRRPSPQRATGGQRAPRAQQQQRAPAAPAAPAEVQPEPIAATPEWAALVEQATALGIRTATTAPPPQAMETATRRLREQIAAKSGETAGDGVDPCAIDGCVTAVWKFDEGGSGLCQEHYAMAEAAGE